VRRRRRGAGLRLLKTSECTIAGGGAAGFFAAIACAEANPSAQVALYEATAHLLAKVRISGGGRCNVTHACFEPRDLVGYFPRGGRELLGPFHRWQPRDTMAWFTERGVELKTEKDGRIFPVSDDSATIVDCLSRAAVKAGVKIHTGMGVKHADRTPTESGYRITLTNGDVVTCGRLLLATGGGRSSAGFTIAQSLGHAIEPPVPSLFTFHSGDPRIRSLEGLSAPDVIAGVGGTRLTARGPLLVTHQGVSGPAILKLSSWAARELAALDYRFILNLNWVGGQTAAQVAVALNEARTAHPKRQIASGNPMGLPARLWERLVAAAGIVPETIWTSVSNAALNALAAQLAAGEFAVSGKSMNKEEFVTCGGVRLGEVDFKTMESKICPGLYLAGEVLDIDGLTGGFNFQAAWTTGWLAGQAMAGSIL
jgi:predicted Rossmann fold flavoprotein